MADMAISGVGGGQAPNTQQPVGEQDFAQVQIQRPVAETSKPKTQDRLLTPAEQEEKEKQQQQPLFEPGTVTEGAVTQITEAFNELMDEINCNLELSFNRKANMLNVKMLDKKTGEVIKEFPPEEMIENMIKADENAEKLRGMFVDKAI